MMEKYLQDNDLLKRILQVFVLTSVLALFTIAIRYLNWRRQYSKLVPCLEPRFFNPFGNMSQLPVLRKSNNGLSILFNGLQFFEAYSNLFPMEKLFVLWAGCHPLVMLKKAEAVEAALKGTKFLNKNFFYTFLNPVLGDGLLASEAQKWKNRRKLLTPSFHHEYLKDFLPEMNEYAQLLVQKLEGETTKEFSDINLPISLCAWDILGSTILGMKFETQTTNKDDLSRFILLMHRLNQLTVKRMLDWYVWPDFIYSLTKDGKDYKKCSVAVKKKFKMIIEERKDEYLKVKLNLDAGRKMSAMDILLKNFFETKKIDEEGMMDETVTLTAGGIDTVANNILVTLYLIGLYPNVQAKIQEELHFIFGDDHNRYANEEDLKDMKYLECVIKESLRIYPTGTLMFREVAEDTVICGYPVFKGSSLGISPWIIHRDKEVFPDPEKFDPDRFLPENCLNRHPFAYIPFSAGPRNCIGKVYALMNEKVVLSTLLRHYYFESLDVRDKLVPGLGVVIQFSKDIRLKIRHNLPSKH